MNIFDKKTKKLMLFFVEMWIILFSGSNLFFWCGGAYSCYYLGTSTISFWDIEL